MYNRGKVIFGIIIFLIAFLSPIWYNFICSTESKKPNVVLPTKYKECVKDADYMKAYHMDLLNEWRDLVVRQDIRFYEKDGKDFLIDGNKAEMSLTKTCLNCHDKKEEFCDQCHNYLDVSPYCWDCHSNEYNPIEIKECPEKEMKDEVTDVTVIEGTEK